jgi:hypothetical protein
MISSNNKYIFHKYYLNFCLSFDFDITNFKIVAVEMRSFKVLATAINKLYFKSIAYFSQHNPGQIQ